MNISLLVAGIFGCVFILMNVIIVGVIFYSQRKTSAVSKWSQTMGTVLISTTERRSSTDGSYTDYPVVMYSYQAGGQTHQSNTIAPGLEVGGSGAGNVIARYPVGSQVAVFFNPQNPSEAVLEKKAPAQLWLWFVLIIMDFILCSIVPALYFLF